MEYYISSKRQRKTGNMNPSQTQIFNNGGSCWYEYDECPLPECLVLEILVRLPVEHVFRFKCISRRWLSIISDPGFPRFYVSHLSSAISTNAWTWLFYPLCTKGSETISTGSFEHVDCIVIGSSYGLLLCLELQVKKTSNLCVCNPLTNQSVALPPAPSKYEFGNIRKIQHRILATNVENDVVTGYKVVQLRIHCRVAAFLELEIFSSETGEWSSTRRVYCPQGVFLKTDKFKPIALNWILYVLDEMNNALVRYDLDNKDDDKCRRLPLPMLGRKSKYNRTLYGVSKGNLRCINMNENNLQENLTLEMWVLKDDHKSSGEWFLEHKVQLSCINADNVCLGPLHFHPSDINMVYLWYSEDLRPCIAVCNLHTGKVEVCHETRLFLDSGWFRVLIPPWPTPLPQPSSRVH